jgi:hypothetical protein
MQALLADITLAAHVLVILFNVAGLIVIPLGAGLGWRVVRVAWLRLLHLAILAAVAAQAIAGRACILTIWQQKLTGSHQAPQPLIMHWVDRLIYWNLPMAFFQVLYCAVFLYVIALTIFVPFRGSSRSSSHPARR